VRGRLIALEGIDGSGKTTQARMYASAVRNAMVTVTAEPGATALGAKLRGLLLDPDRTPVAERTEALLLAADRAQHVAEVVEPALASGRWVVTDRFSGSTLAYQGYGRGLSLTDLRRLVDWATGGIEPDLNVLVDVPVEVSRRRRAGGTASGRAAAPGWGVVYVFPARRWRVHVTPPTGCRRSQQNVISDCLPLPENV